MTRPKPGRPRCQGTLFALILVQRFISISSSAGSMLTIVHRGLARRTVTTLNCVGRAYAGGAAQANQTPSSGRDRETVLSYIGPTWCPAGALELLLVRPSLCHMNWASTIPLLSELQCRSEEHT